MDARAGSRAEQPLAQLLLSAHSDAYLRRAFAKLGRDYSPLMAALAERSKAVVHAFAPQNMAALIWYAPQIATRHGSDSLATTLRNQAKGPNLAGPSYVGHASAAVSL